MFHGGLEVMAWGMVSYLGDRVLVRLDNTLNGPGCLHLLQREVRWERFQVETLSLRQDKAGPHRYISANDWLEEHVDVEEWPSNRPDLSPIENVWAFIKDEFYKVRGRHTRDDVWREAVQIWYSERLDDVIGHLYDTIHHRIQELIEKNGNSINY